MATVHEQITDRDEDNRKRKQRLAKIKRGPGTFVYNGGFEDVHHEPTPLLRGKREPAFNADDSLKVDRSGRQVFERQGTPKRDESGKIILGGVPKETRTPIDAITIRGIVLPKGEPVRVDNVATALKLRCMGGFTELDDDEAPGPVAPKRGRGRPRKQTEAKAEPDVFEDEDGDSDE